MSTQGEWRAQDKGGRRPGTPEGDGRALDRITAVEEEAKIARAERDKAKTVALKIHGYLGFPGDVLNKAQLYDHGLK